MNGSTKPSNGNGWRFSKEIPVTVVGFIVMQTIALTWFLAGQSAQLKTVVDANESNKILLYTKDDARREREFMEKSFSILALRADENARRIATLEIQMAEVVRARAGAR